MGSYSASSSNTQYTNAPVTQEDVTNPLNLINSTARFGSDMNIGGSVSIVNNSDAQTVTSAFDFGSKLVQVVADITKNSNAAKNDAATGAVKDAVTGEDTATTAAAFDWTKYKTELMAAGAIVVFWYFGGFKK